jgi:hypothetical protein
VLSQLSGQDTFSACFFINCFDLILQMFSFFFEPGNLFGYRRGVVALVQLPSSVSAQFSGLKAFQLIELLARVLPLRLQFFQFVTQLAGKLRVCMIGGTPRQICLFCRALALRGAKSSLVHTFLVFWSDVFEGVSAGCCAGTIAALANSRQAEKTKPEGRRDRHIRRTVSRIKATPSFSIKPRRSEESLSQFLRSMTGFAFISSRRASSD